MTDDTATKKAWYRSVTIEHMVEILTTTKLPSGGYASLNEVQAKLLCERTFDEIVLPDVEQLVEQVARTEVALGHAWDTVLWMLAPHTASRHVRWVGFPRANKSEHYCQEDQQAWPCSTVANAMEGLGIDRG